MDRALIQAELQTIFHDVLRAPGFVPTPEMETGAHPNWTSIANVEILLSAEELWGFEFSSADIDGVRSFGDLIDAVAAKLG